MAQLICPSCNGIDFDEMGRFYVCQHCGARMERDASTIAATVSSDESVTRLMERADLYWELGKIDRAVQLYKQVLDIDASNEIARKRSAGKKKGLFS